MSDLISRPVSQEAAEFNNLSAHIQSKLGINPDECLRVVTFPSQGDARTLLPSFFEGLQRREWRTPETGEFLTHDKTLHWPGVRELHPAFVPMVIWAAAVGEEHFKARRTDEANDMGNKLDFFIDKYALAINLNNILRLCDVDPAHETLSFPMQALHRTQIRTLQEVFTDGTAMTSL